MNDLERTLGNLYELLVDGIGSATITAGFIRDPRIKKKVYKLLEEEAKHFAQFRIKLFDLLNE
jgi:hypothetical protein